MTMAKSQWLMKIVDEIATIFHSFIVFLYLFDKTWDGIYFGIGGGIRNFDIVIYVFIVILVN
jgi:hypothetical protein